jgi:nanoRNase/pAp phosphatase (c-di-AMP/oligoRNAs hydrolase)
MLNQEQQVFEQISKANTILVTTNRAAGGDAVASALATYLFLKKLDKNVELVFGGNTTSSSTLSSTTTDLSTGESLSEDTSVVTNKPNNKDGQFSFLPAFDQIKSKLDNLRKFVISLNIGQTKVGQIQYKVEGDLLNFIVAPIDGFFTKEDVSTSSSNFKFDLIIVVAVQDLESLGSIYEQNTDFFFKTTIINIDHQPANESFGQINIININAVSTTETLYNLFTAHNKELINEDIATCLLTGIITATKSFKTNNISPAALTTASQLITLGARREEIVNNLYRSRSLNLLKLWGIVLARMTGGDDNKVISSMINNDDFKKTTTGPDDLSDVIDELIINIPQAKIIVLVYERIEDEQKKTEAIVYGVKNLDVYTLLNNFNPSGNKSLIKLISDKPIKEFEKELTDILNEKIKKLEI